MLFLKKIMWVMVMCCAAVAARAEIVEPDVLIRNTVQEVIAIIKTDKAIQAGDEEKIIALVNVKVLPHFDFARMTQLAVGKYWRTATPEQKQVLITEFRNMLVRTYTKVFTVYRDQKVEVRPYKLAVDDASQATVKTLISKPGTQAVLVDYEMKKSEGGWKAYDISIEGVSMVMSYRGTFATKIQENGIEGLIKMLIDKNAQSNGKMTKAGAK